MKIFLIVFALWTVFKICFSCYAELNRGTGRFFTFADVVITGMPFLAELMLLSIFMSYAGEKLESWISDVCVWLNTRLPEIYLFKNGKFNKFWVKSND